MIGKILLVGNGCNYIDHIVNGCMFSTGFAEMKAFNQNRGTCGAASNWSHN